MGVVEESGVAGVSSGQVNSEGENGNGQQLFKSEGRRTRINRRRGECELGITWGPL